MNLNTGINGLQEFADAEAHEIEQAVQLAGRAFPVYRRLSLKQRADFLRAIATGIEALGDELLLVADKETFLGIDRLATERKRTLFQLRSYADACENGFHLDVRIDPAEDAKPDLRKMMLPLGPVVVFGAANFPFAYSTAGGDTACALAAGCPVIVKAHPAHSNTSELVARAIHKAVALYHLPEGVFIHLHGAASRVGQTLVEHPLTAAVAFTGSFAGGKQLFDWAAARRVPIPVFAEMSSINPVYLLPGQLEDAPADTVKKLAISITSGVGQFCTNPGLLIGLKSRALDEFIELLSDRISNTEPATMLNPGIFKNYVEKRGNALAQTGVDLKSVSSTAPEFNQAAATLAITDAQSFISNPILQMEVFGPFSLMVVCNDQSEMLSVARSLEGQLTGTLIANRDDLANNRELVEAVQYNCGRLILNGVPTGVEVSLAMQHGGPYPSTTDSRFTSVGADGIRRFVRPVTFQNWPDDLLPEELKNENPLGIWRTVNHTPAAGPIRPDLPDNAGAKN